MMTNIQVTLILLGSAPAHQPIEEDVRLHLEDGKHASLSVVRILNGTEYDSARDDWKFKDLPALHIEYTDGKRRRHGLNYGKENIVRIARELGQGRMAL